MMTAYIIIMNFVHSPFTSMFDVRVCERRIHTQIGFIRSARKKKTSEPVKKRIEAV